MELRSLYREPEQRNDVSFGALEFHDVFRIFRSGPAETVALRGLDLHIEPRELVALYGPSGSGKSTALHIAAQRRDAVWIKFLLGKGANPNLETRDGESPLEVAVQIGSLEAVEALLDGGAAANVTNAPADFGPRGAFQADFPLKLQQHITSGPQVRRSSDLL